MQLFIKQIFFESITDATLGRKANGVAGSLEEEAGVIGVAADKMRVGIDIVMVMAGVVIEAGIAKIGAGTVGVGVGVVKVGVGGAGVRETGVRRASVEGAGVGGVSMGAAGVVLEQTGVVGSKTGSRSRPA